MGNAELDLTERNILMLSVMSFNKLSLHQGPLKKKKVLYSESPFDLLQIKKLDHGQIAFVNGSYVRFVGPFSYF